MPDDDAILQLLREDIAEIKIDVKEIRDFIDGNGRPGYKTRMALAEEKLNVLAENVKTAKYWRLTFAGIILAASIPFWVDVIKPRPIGLTAPALVKEVKEPAREIELAVQEEHTPASPKVEAKPPSEKKPRKRGKTS